MTDYSSPNNEELLRKHREFLSPEEMEAFVGAAHDYGGRQGLVLRTFLGTGARVREIKILKVGDLFLSEGYVRVHSRLVETSRRVPIHESLIRELRDHVEERESGRLFRGLIGNAGYNTYQTVPSLRRSMAGLSFHEIAKQVGITGPIYTTGIRYSIGHLLAIRGISVDQIKAILGHYQGREICIPPLMEILGF